jgi:hypothetical protein
MTTRYDLLYTSNSEGMLTASQKGMEAEGSRESGIKD